VIQPSILAGDVLAVAKGDRSFSSGLARELLAIKAEPLTLPERAGGDLAEAILPRHATGLAVRTIPRSHPRAFLAGYATDAYSELHERGRYPPKELSIVRYGMKHRFFPISGQMPSLDESTSGKKSGNSLHLENGKHMLFITWGTYQLVPGGAMQLGNPDRCLYRLRTVPAESGSIQGLRTLVYRGGRWPRLRLATADSTHRPSMSFGTGMPMQEMDVELGHERKTLCRSLCLKVTDGVPRGAVNPGRFYLFNS